MAVMDVGMRVATIEARDVDPESFDSYTICKHFAIVDLTRPKRRTALTRDYVERQV